MSSFVLRNFLAGLPELYREFGKNIDQLIDEVGTSHDIFNVNNELVDYSVCGQILETAARQFERPDFALLLAEKRREIQYSNDIVTYSLTAKNVEDFIRGMVSQLRTRTLGIQYVLETDNRNACFSRTLDPHNNIRFPQGVILFFASYYNIVRDATDYKWTPSHISFTFKCPENHAALKKYFKCHIQYDAELDGLYFDKKLLELPIPTRDDNIRRMLSEYLTSQQLLGKTSFRETVKTAIQKNLAIGRPDIDALSVRLPYQSRTIQKKLKEIGTSYFEILNETRLELAENLLSNTDNPLTYIAQRLCFQNLSAFSNVFKKHYGISPSQWKKNRTKR